MKNLKTIALGLVVGAMAIGFSSFTNAHKSIKKGLTDYQFFRKLTAPAHSHANADYEYRPNGGCVTNTGTDCDANFLQASAPTIVGQSPTGSYDGVIESDAKWDGN